MLLKLFPATLTFRIFTKQLACYVFKEDREKYMIFSESNAVMNQKKFQAK